LLLRGLWKLTKVEPALWRAPVGALLFFLSCLLLPWVLRAFSSDHARNNRTLLLFSLWPGSIYFRSGYAEALYLPLLLGSLGFMLRKRWLPAALLAGAAWFTRTPAVVLVGTLAVAIVLDAAKRPTLRLAIRHAWLRLSWALPIAALGMLGYVAMVNSAVGDPWAWRKAYVGWGSIEILSTRGIELRTAVDAFWFLSDRPTVKLATLTFVLTPILVWVQRATMPPVLVAFAAGAWCFFLSQDWALAPYLGHDPVDVGRVPVPPRGRGHARFAADPLASDRLDGLARRQHGRIRLVRDAVRQQRWAS
jgi:hypothetical protein